MELNMIVAVMVKYTVSITVGSIDIFFTFAMRIMAAGAIPLANKELIKSRSYSLNFFVSKEDKFLSSSTLTAMPVPTATAVKFLISSRRPI
jgi:hypothetical protein